ncbi:MAG TPA: helix-turn-helix transcriptional regulator [Gemmatimonadales bacterium]|nr:helix-turn-helix transcriptional regulator [Gemmatimonadales bacterium]
MKVRTAGQAHQSRPEPPMPHAFEYFEFDPAPSLARHITSYWGFRVLVPDPPVHRIWPDGCIAIAAVSTPDQAYWTILGPRLGPLDVPVRAGASYWGARFWPDAGGAVLGMHAPELRDVTLVAPASLTNLIGHPPPALREGDQAAAADALDALLRPLVERTRPLDDAVRHAVVAIVAARGARPIAEIAAEIGIGERQLQRRFRAAVGLTPKQFARIRRLRAAGQTALAGTEPWAQVAATHGFADQSHLIHEFSQMTGLTPVAFEARLRQIGHGRLIS